MLPEGTLHKIGFKRTFTGYLGGSLNYTEEVLIGFHQDFQQLCIKKHTVFCSILVFSEWGLSSFSCPNASLNENKNLSCFKTEETKTH